MKHRYPGPRSFTGDDRPLFFGRDAETQELYRLIVLNDLLVLFGESGSGKTSLLKAGVCPELEERNYKPVFIRLNNPQETPELQVCHQLKEGGYIPADMPEDRTLWEYFSRFWYVDLGEAFTPVIVFDQFEELFTFYQPEQRQAFIEQYAAIANRRPPAGVPPEMTTAPKAKFIFSLRSDFLYLLDELSSNIPSILRCRFQLRALSRDHAAEAITQPAAKPGDFASPVFGYESTALEGILDALSRSTEEAQVVAPTTLRNPDNQQLTRPTVQQTEIAAFQLQMVCRFLEDKIIRQNKPAGFQVSPEFYGGGSGIRQVIEEFYEQVIQKIDPAVQNAVEKMLARGLIRNGRRIMMEASALEEEYKIDPSILDFLQEERLLKREARKGDLYYEISHDNLIKPVLVRYKMIEEVEKAAAEKAEAERKLAEEKAEAERLLAEKELRLNLEIEEKKREAVLAEIVLAKKQRKLARMIAVMSFVMVLLLLFFGIWVVKTWVDSIHDGQRMVELNCWNEQFSAAREGVESIMMSPRKRWILEKRGENVEALERDVQQLGNQYLRVEKLIKHGDSLYFAERPMYAEALSYYREAQDSIEAYKTLNQDLSGQSKTERLRVDPARIDARQNEIQLRIQNAQGTIEKNFAISLREMEAFNEARVYGQVLRNLLTMKALLPSNAVDLYDLQRSLRLSESPVVYINRELARVNAIISRK